MFNYFIFNKKQSLEDFNLYFETLPLLPLVADVNQDVHQIVCTCGFKTDKAQLLRIKKWLSTTGRLKFSFDDRVFSVKKITAQESVKNINYTVIIITFTVDNVCLLQSNPIEFTKDFHQINLYNGGNYESLPLISIEGSGNISITINDEDKITAQESVKNINYTVIIITFTVDNVCIIQSNPIEFTKDFHQINLYNNGNYESSPLMVIEGEGDISITINNEDCCTIENVNGVVTIDSQIQECWAGNQEDISSLKNRDFYGEFPVLAEGMNHICIDSTTNNLVKVIIEPRWAI